MHGSDGGNLRSFDFTVCTIGSRWSGLPVERWRERPHQRHFSSTMELFYSQRSSLMLNVSNRIREEYSREMESPKTEIDELDRYKILSGRVFMAIHRCKVHCIDSSLSNSWVFMAFIDVLYTIIILLSRFVCILSSAMF